MRQKINIYKIEALYKRERSIRRVSEITGHSRSAISAAMKRNNLEIDSVKGIKRKEMKKWSPVQKFLDQTNRYFLSMKEISVASGLPYSMVAQFFYNKRRSTRKKMFALLKKIKEKGKTPILIDEEFNAIDFFKIENIKYEVKIHENIMIIRGSINKKKITIKVWDINKFLENLKIEANG